MPTAVEAAAGRIAPRTAVTVRVTNNINVEALKNLVATIAGHTGCLTCGLLGVDLRLSGDPVEGVAIGKIPGVQSVSFE
jgi:hypothetical protein